MISHITGIILAAMSVIWGGVVDLHPKLRIGFFEPGDGSPRVTRPSSLLKFYVA